MLHGVLNVESLIPRDNPETINDMTCRIECLSDGIVEC